MRLAKADTEIVTPPNWSPMRHMEVMRQRASGRIDKVVRFVITLSRPDSFVPTELLHQEHRA